MKTIVLACQTLRDEVLAAHKITGCTHEIVWIESGLHTFPDKLNSRLQEELNRISSDFDAQGGTCNVGIAEETSYFDAQRGTGHVDISEETCNLKGIGRVLMVFGFCGNSVLGITTGNYELIIPRVDDCITLILGSLDARKAAMAESPTYFLTNGWLKHESNVWKEYQNCLEKYGQEDTDMIFKTILAHYVRLGVIDTGCYEFEPFYKTTEKIAKTLNLKPESFSGTISYIEELLTGPWTDARFLTVPPGGTISLDMLNL